MLSKFSYLYRQPVYQTLSTSVLKHLLKELQVTLHTIKYTYRPLITSEVF